MRNPIHNKPVDFQLANITTIGYYKPQPHSHNITSAHSISNSRVMVEALSQLLNAYSLQATAIHIMAMGLAIGRHALYTRF